MRVIVTRNTFVRGDAFEADPEPVDLPDALAKELLGLGKAELAPNPVVVQVVSAVSTETAGESAERTLALERFTRVLETARKKPTGPIAQIFQTLGVAIADPEGQAEPYPPHVLMAQAIDALVKIDDPTQRNTALIGLFGKSVKYAEQLVDERSQALGEGE